MTARDIGGETPPHYAATESTAVALLTDRGADMPARDVDGKFPADQADDNQAPEGNEVRGRLNIARADKIYSPVQQWFWSSD